MDSTACPCLSGQIYQNCCGLLHQGKQTAVTAEQLMRSRYCAFVMHHSEYLQSTLHPSRHQPDDITSLQKTMQTTQWLGLTIIDHNQDGDEAEVEFIAFYADNPLGQLHERSRFCRQNGQWFYLEGQFMPPIKLGRNESCVCGSGKKLKCCHG